jgi:cardiolipin synthase (CMP-forming)
MTATRSTSSDSMTTSRSPLRHLPNALTVLRMALVVPLTWLIIDRRFNAALVIAAIAGATDAFDGLLAKRFGWVSWLGGILDPIADKLMLTGCYVSLALIGAQPAWVTWIVVGRDVVIVLGAVAYHNLIGRLDAQPTLLSKITTCVQITFVLAQLVNLTSWFALPTLLLSALMWLTAVLTIVSGLQYVVVWSNKARIERRKKAV